MADPSVNSSLTGESVSQKAYTISGVPIIFPYKAYPSQITMMDKIVKCLNKQYNCLLESPTGSGKSLALLCATLAWLRKAEREKREMDSVLEKHLNAYGIAVADVADCSVESPQVLKNNFEQFEYSKSNSLKSVKSEYFVQPVNSNHTKMTDVSVSQNPGISPKSYASDSKILTSCNIDNKISKLNVSSPYFKEDKLNKRGIIYIDDDNDDDFNDFQPLKRNKLFNVTKDTSCCASPIQNPEVLIPDKSLMCDSRDISPEHSKSSNNFDSNSVTNSKSILETQVNNTIPARLPKIYFGTRTHKQIGQIIRELKKTPYKDVKMTVLSSRERTCIHPANCRSRNKNEGCEELINGDNGPSCNFYKNLRRTCYYHPPEMASAFDLEDFVNYCRRKKICPYFGAREMLATSEIVFCPYNYLVDPLIRGALSIFLKGNIIIMDEAHNIEDSARDAASGCISVTQLQEAISDVLQISQLKDDDREPYLHIAKVLENLKKWLENCQDLNDYVSFDSSCKVWSGNDMIAVLDYVGLGPDTFPTFQSQYSKIVKDENENGNDKPAEFKVPKLSGSTHMSLKTLTETLNYLYKDQLIYVPDYRCVIMRSKASSDDRHLSQSFKRKSFPKPDYEITMNFWCLNPAVAFSDMKGVHSIIVASGTLAPLTSFQSELGIPFQMTLEANHVVCKEHMWIGTIGKGPSNNSLNATFQNASTYSFQDDIGNLILEVCSVIPHGVLCFLPSYGMLDKLVNRWQITGLWNKLLMKKLVVCEPRRANEDFQQVMQDFYDAVRDSETPGSSDTRGALFFAVCRGKVSEGLDFADNNARAVITVGIPFPNIKDVQVDLKKKYNDLYASKRQIVTGKAWYEMQAFRAINQALGRCIRHRNDFGALIIVDERFQKYNSYTSSLSKWIRKDICHYPTFHDALNSLNEFADRMGLKNRYETD